HDPGTPSGDDGEFLFAEPPGRFDRDSIPGVRRLGSSGSEYRHRPLDIRQLVESLDEFPGDAENAPRIGVREGPALPHRATFKEPLVFGPPLSDWALVGLIGQGLRSPRHGLRQRYRRRETAERDPAA